MDKIRFVHLSDPHFDLDYSERNIMRLHNKTGITLTEQLIIGLAHIRENCGHLDFMLLTGDLVHEGKAEDYTALRKLFEKYSGVPLYITTGNHDNDSIWRGWLGADLDGSYNYETFHEKGGLRILSLDSRGGPYGSGILNNHQLNWLREKLAVRNEAGSLLLIHHTPHISGEEPYLVYQMQEPSKLHEIIGGSDVIGIFSGHTHKNFVSMFGAIPCYTARSITFSIDTTEEHMAWDNITGYNLCELSGGKLTVENVRIMPDVLHSEVITYRELYGDLMDL